jgi:hypothetical protein
MARTKANKAESVEPQSDVVMDEAPTSHQPERGDEMSVDEENEEVEVEDNDAEIEEDIQRVRLVCLTITGVVSRHCILTSG